MKIKTLLLGLIALICFSCNNDSVEPYKDNFVAKELPTIVPNTNPKAFTKNAEQNTTLETLTRVDEKGELYFMNYTADYGLNAMIAAGGVKSNNELLGYVQQYLLNIPRSRTMTLEHDFGCSSFLAKTKDGHYLFCRNFDYVYESPVNVITRTKGTIGTFNMNMAIKSATSGSPDDGKSDNSFYVAAPLAVMDGMNDHGVAISVLVVMSYGAEQYAEGKSNLTTTAVMREILDNATNVDEALDIFDSHNFYAHGGTWQSNYHFFLADATGRSVVVEYVNSGRDNQQDKSYQKIVIESKIATNNFLYEPFREPINDTWRESYLSSYSLNDIKGKSEAFDILLALSQVHDPDRGRAILPGETAGPNSFPQTLWSVVYDLTEKKAYYITGRENMEGKDPYVVSMMP